MAVIQRIQRGTASLTGSSVTATVTAYTLAQSFIVWSYTGGQANAEQGSVTVEKTSTTVITWTRVGGGGGGMNITIGFELVEFDSDVNVEEATRTADGTIAIDSVTLSQSWLLTSKRNVAANIDDNVHATAVFNSQTEIEVDTAAGDTTGVYEIQVIDYGSGASTQENLHTLTTSTVTSTTDTITAVGTVGNTMVIGSLRTDNTAGDLQDDIWRITITADDTITMDRNNGNQDTININHFTVEFTDGTSLQTTAHTVIDTDATDDVDITAVDRDTSSVHLGGCSTWGMSHGDTAITNDDPRDAFFQTVFLDDDTITVTREQTVGACDLNIQVTEWNTAAGLTTEYVAPIWQQGESGFVGRVVI